VNRYCRCGTALASDNTSHLCSVCRATHGRTAAPEVPVEFWRTDVMTAALESGDLGRVLHAYRSHPFHRQRLSQALLASWLHMSQAAVCRIEQGRRRLTIDELANVAQALGMPIALPWTVEHPSEAGEDVEPISRRALFGTGVGAALGLNTSNVLPPAGQVDCLGFHGPDDATDGPLSPRRPDGLDRLVATLTHQGPAVTSADAPIDIPTLIQAAASAKRNFQACRYALVVGELDRLLRTLPRAAASLDGDDALRAWTVSAHAYHTTAGVLLKLGHDGLAYIAAGHSMESAQRSQDALVVGSSARIVVHAFLSSGHIREAIRTATSAATKLDELARTDDRLAISGSLMLRAAIAAARGGDRTGALELLAKADDAARAFGEARSDRWTGFGKTNVLLHRVHVAVALGDAGTALRHARAVDPDRLAITERRTSLYIDAARALVQWRKYADACHALAAVERLAPEALSSTPSVRGMVGELVHHAPRSAQPAARALAARVGGVS
jgi:hypothetical protein